MSKFRPAAVAVPKSAPVDELETVANRRDLSTLEERLNALDTNAVHVGGVLASMADMCDLLMHRADEPTTLAALNPIDPRTRGMLVDVTVWRGEVHLLKDSLC
jgi:methyl coenzyme M reductase subunit C